MPQWSNKQYLIATYHVTTADPDAAATAIARGQSVGNPTITTAYETPEFLEKFQARTYWFDSTTLEVAWPARLFQHTSLSHLLSVVSGGQCDIDVIRECQLLTLDLTCVQDQFLGPRYGIEGVRHLLLDVFDRPLIGGIIKPKIGLTPLQMADVCKQMADGGIDFIKEDEILGNPLWCPLVDRVYAIAKALESYHVLYAPCITGDGSQVWKKARIARSLGATAVHCNLWAGMGTYLDVRTHVDIPLFFQKSGDKCWTRGPFSIDYAILCQLAHLAGCDFAHVGMYGGYLADTKGDLDRRIAALKTTIPSFSCGMTPELAVKCTELFGKDIMVTSGGWIHGHPKGITQAVKELRAAVST